MNPAVAAGALPIEICRLSVSEGGHARRGDLGRSRSLTGEEAAHPTYPLKRGIPMLELDLEYAHPAGAQVQIRAQAFMEMLETRAS
jgi:hypothetical protein